MSFDYDKAVLELEAAGHDHPDRIAQSGDTSARAGLLSWWDLLVVPGDEEPAQHLASERRRVTPRQAGGRAWLKVREFPPRPWWKRWKARPAVSRHVLH